MMSAETMVQLVFDQMTEVQADQPDLELILSDTGEMIVRGTVRFSIDHDGRAYKDSYQVDIAISSDYPDSPPTVKETGGVVPADFHRFPTTGNLCLAAPVELCRVFSQNRTLHHYVNRLLIPYLFSYTYFRQHGQLPHGELSHGLIGLIEYYKEFFDVVLVTAMKLLKLLADNFAPPLMACPCDSGRKLQDCHSPKLDELRPLLPPEHFEKDLREMIEVAQAAEIRLPERHVMPKRMWKQKQRRLLKEAKAQRQRGNKRCR